MAKIERKKEKFLSKTEEKIIESLRKSKSMRIKDLVRILGMYDSNLRKRIKVLFNKGMLERYVEDNYTCVRIKNRSEIQTDS
jgi:predicted ArsR family transcriptional regulator